MIILFWGIHIGLCILLYIGMKKNWIQISPFLFPIVVFVPYCGELMALTEHLVSKHPHMGKKDIGLEKLKIDDIKYQRIEVDDDVNEDITVPLEEAILLNDAQTRRKLMMDILHKNPEDYIELLQRARLADDTELSHYATTTMMEIQSQYELTFHRLEEELQYNPGNMKLWKRYRRELIKYINAGLLTGTVLAIYREKLEHALQILLEQEPENKRYFLEDLDNKIDLEEKEGIPEKLNQAKLMWPEEEKVYQLYVKYFWKTGDGESIHRILQEISDKEIYLSYEGKQWFTFWNNRE